MSQWFNELNRTVKGLYADATRVTYGYDAAGQRLVTQDVTGLTSYLYDGVSRQSAVSYPTGKVLSSSFDGAGNRSQRTAAREATQLGNQPTSF